MTGDKNYRLSERFYVIVVRKKPINIKLMGSFYQSSTSLFFSRTIIGVIQCEL